MNEFQRYRTNQTKSDHGSVRREYRREYERKRKREEKGNVKVEGEETEIGEKEEWRGVEERRKQLNIRGRDG